MASLRFIVDISIPEEPTGTLILSHLDTDTGQQVGGIKLPALVAQHLTALRNEIQLAKSYARKINEGQSNEEMTVKTSYHICHHDEQGIPCEPEQEI